MSSEKKLTILQQNDLHGYLLSHPEGFYDGAGRLSFAEAGGLARIAALVSELRNMHGEPLLFIDGGDLFHGTGYAVEQKGQMIQEAYQSLNLDVFVPGNWDFAYGSERLQTLAQKVAQHALSANVTFASDGRPYLPPYAIIERTGLTLGLIGLSYGHETVTMPGKFSDGLRFTLGEQELKKYIWELTGAGVDLIIVVSHMGFPADVALAQKVDGIDLILSAHSHDRILEPVRVHDTLIVQSGAHGSFLTELVLTLLPGERGRMRSKKIIAHAEHRLIPLLSHLPEDPSVAAHVARLTQEYRERKAEPIGEVRTPLHRLSLLSAPMDRLLTDAYKWRTRVDVAFSHAWRYGVPVLPGTIRAQHLDEIIPTNPFVFTAEIDGYTLRDALEHNLEQVFSRDPLQQKGGYVIRTSGLVMTIKPYNPLGQRIQELLIGGKAWQGSKMYRIAGAGEQILKGYAFERSMTGEKAHDVLRAYFAAHGPIEVDERTNVIAV
ncbi:MAG: 5'-nucleotidase C-terminal domain-containing protein [Candidatus Carbobacillus altaicus]|nr:5'-nucleotidase C-terminal domain-containing protein [Candidatus Carbobacillus altaicus]